MQLIYFMYKVSEFVYKKIYSVLAVFTIEIIKLLHRNNEISNLKIGTFIWI
jgi:hypothetical protein